MINSSGIDPEFSRDKGIRWKKLFDDVLDRVRIVANEFVAYPTRLPLEGSGQSISTHYERLKKVVLTDEVSRTLFEEYARHRETDRGNEEMGWVLLGLRQIDHAIVLATLPASGDRDAGEAHVWITGVAHILASRIIRQNDRRLTMLGVVHTHPGSLRHPSRGDFKGDRNWVGQLRGSEGIFAIGTADAEKKPMISAISLQPQPNMQCLSGLRFSWYTLADGDESYQEIPLELTIGPDRAKPLREIWGLIENHALRLERLASQQSKVRFELTRGRNGEALSVTIPLATPDDRIRIVLEQKESQYYFESGQDVFHVDLGDVPPDQGTYMLLAELAARG